MSSFHGIENWADELSDRLRRENSLRRRLDRAAEREAEIAEAENEVTNSRKPIKIVSIDFQATANAAKHHCDKYELIEREDDVSVLRRGSAYTILVTFNREVDLKKGEHFKLYMSFGPYPSTPKGTQAALSVSGKTTFDKSHEDWDIRIAKKEPAKVTFEIQVPTDAPVGIWKTTAEITDRNDRSQRHLLRSEHLTYVLFNPWNENDTTYMAEEEEREEYVLNDIGKIWVGEYRKCRSRPWVFGQFDDAVLPACILMMERAGVSYENRGDPVLVSRAISRIASHQTEGGVLFGNWSEDYADGMKPTDWSGSIDILEAYMRTGRAVKYGQCWVFAGIVNTVCRAFGLPSRVVTNLESAHDTNASLTIDKYYDKDGEKYEWDYSDSSHTGPEPLGGDDSIWDFHVWNDVWMARPDLPEGYGGWQVVDGTPQEKSDGAFQCGPVSHEAIRRGDMHLKYDVPFVLAEVNADIVHWQVDEESQGGFRRLGSNKYRVGRQVLTKAVGDVKRAKRDVTQEYKPAEGTEAERIALYRAAARSRTARNALRMPSETKEDVDFSLLDIERVPIGDDFTITFSAKNKSDELRTVDVLLKASSTYYTGAKAHLITKAEGVIKLAPQEEKTMPFPVRSDRYYPLLVEHAMMKMEAFCRVKETSYAWIGEDKFQVTKPDIDIKILSNAVANQPMNVQFSFTNPLPVTLRECSLTIDAPGIMRPKKIPLVDVKPKGEMVYAGKLYPRRAKTSTLVAIFNSKELLDLTGTMMVTVAPQ